MVGSRVEVGGQLSGQGLDITVRDQRVDEPVAAVTPQVLIGEAEAAEVEVWHRAAGPLGGEFEQRGAQGGQRASGHGYPAGIQAVIQAVEVLVQRREKFDVPVGVLRMSRPEAEPESVGKPRGDAVVRRRPMVEL